MRSKFAIKLIISIAIILLVVILLKELNVYNLIRKQVYKQEYSEYVTRYAEENGIDNFYVSSYNSTLSNLLFENQELDENFYTKLCLPLFKGKKLLEVIKLFYEPKKFYEIKKNFKIDSNNIKPLLFGYRFCLNELFKENNQGIYYLLYTNDYRKYINDRFYPGNDSKINIVYSDIIKHFENKPNEGCYVCLCKKWHYHSVPSGFPGDNELNMKCPECSQNIGSYIKDGNTTIVKREKYYRIFKDDDEIEEIQNSDKNKKMKEINYMTLKQLDK